MNEAGSPQSGGTRPEIARVLPAVPHGSSLAWWGALMALVAFGMLLSGVLFAYAFLSAQAGGWPPAETPRPPLGLPTAGTTVLLVSVVPAVLVQRAGKGHRPAFLQPAAALTALLGVGHLVLLGLSLADLPMGPTEGAYGSTVVVLLALHHLALASGVVGLAILALQVWGDPGERQVGSARGLALWWLGLVGLWVLVYATVHLSPLVLGGGGR